MIKTIFLLLLVLLLYNCASFPKNEITKVKLEIEGLYYADLPKYLPEEWKQLKELWQKLDEVERNKDVNEAYRLYYYANYKISQIDEKLENKRKEEEEKIKLAKKLLEEEKLKQKIEAEKKQDLDKEVQKSDITMEKQEINILSVMPKQKKTLEDIRYKIEKRFPSFYTVREDDTLEKIAEFPFIYNDKYYWPLIYKYNRDQISNPKKLYKGQILKIPRNITMEDIYIARKEAGAPMPKNIPKRAYTPDKYKQVINELLMED